MFASTLAASVTLNNGDAVEFGQGAGLVIACDISIVTRINEEWSDMIEDFRVSTIELTDLNVAVSAAQDSGCGGKVIKIQLLDDSGVPLFVGDSGQTPFPDLTEISVTLTIDGDGNPSYVSSGATAVFVETIPDEGTLTVTIDGSELNPLLRTVHPLAADVYRVTLESESPGPGV